MNDKTKLWQQASRFQSLLVLILMIVAMSLLSDRFLTASNGANILRQISVNVCLSIGMTIGDFIRWNRSVGWIGARAHRCGDCGADQIARSSTVVGHRTPVHNLGSDPSGFSGRRVPWFGSMDR